MTVKKSRVEQMEDEATVPAKRRRSAVIQADLDDVAPARALVAEAQLTADTLKPMSGLFAAQSSLERMLGGMESIALSFSTASPSVSSKENIIGTAVGFRRAGSSLTDELAVKVFVREKLPMSRIAGEARIPPTIEGYPTDVEAIGEIVLQMYSARYPRAVPCGVSCSNINLGGSGTVGAVVVLGNSKLCILSNNHVLANSNMAQINDPIIQPGNSEPSPAPDQMIARLEKFVPIQANGNTVDGAVARTNFARVSPKHVTFTLSPEPTTASIGMTVAKNGRTTESTVGSIVYVGANISVKYPPMFPAGAVFTNQIVVSGLGGLFSSPGDSGALVVTAGSKQPVGLLFAGGGGYTFVNPIADVMSALDIDRFVADPAAEE